MSLKPHGLASDILDGGKVEADGIPPGGKPLAGAHACADDRLAGCFHGVQFVRHQAKHAVHPTKPDHSAVVDEKRCDLTNFIKAWNGKWSPSRVLSRLDQE